MKIFVSAGEVSGDAMLGAILMGLRSRFPSPELMGLGGEAAARAGLRPLFPLVRTAFSGAGDVLRSAPFALGMRRKALEALEQFRPDLALLVDYPGLNLGLARRALSLGVPVYYVAPPQAWVYRDPDRKLRKARRSLAGAAVQVMFPFEAGHYGFAARVASGHFLAAVPGSTRSPLNLLCLCPGSRLPVLRRNLPAWLAALHEAGITPGAPAAPDMARIAVLVPAHLGTEARRLVRPWQGRLGNIEVTSDKLKTLREARWALAFPGTITLELALNGVPTAVAAALDPLTLWLGRRLLRGPDLGLPNLLLRERVFPEWAGTRGHFRGRAMAGLWEALRAQTWDWGALHGRLAAAMGPACGARTALEECSLILNNS